MILQSAGIGAMMCRVFISVGGVPHRCHRPSGTEADATDEAWAPYFREKQLDTLLTEPRCRCLCKWGTPVLPVESIDLSIKNGETRGQYL
jgi:hypothetical protein